MILYQSVAKNNSKNLRGFFNEHLEGFSIGELKCYPPNFVLADNWIGIKMVLPAIDPYSASIVSIPNQIPLQVVASAERS